MGFWIQIEINSVYIYVWFKMFFVNLQGNGFIWLQCDYQLVVYQLVVGSVKNLMGNFFKLNYYFVIVFWQLFIGFYVKWNVGLVYIINLNFYCDEGFNIVLVRYVFFVVIIIIGFFVN